ncbi:MAG: hypothetical protein V4719_00140 [Planctomycetota bacterium]
MTFPHPQSRQDEYGQEDIPSRASVIGDFFKWTINITDDRNTKDNMNPAKNRTFSALVHDIEVSELVSVRVDIVNARRDSLIMAKQILQLRD